MNLRKRLRLLIAGRSLGLWPWTDLYLFCLQESKSDKEHYELNDTIYLDIDIENTGKRAGKEVVQLYVNDKVSSMVTP